MDTRKIMVVGSISTSVLVAVSFLAALVIAYLSKDQTNLGLMIGAVIAQFSTVVSFWVGSSAGSQKKDDAAADLQRPPPAPTPAPP